MKQEPKRENRGIARVAGRYALVWAADALSFGLTAFLVPGIYFLRSGLWYLHPFTVALVFSLLNTLVRPALMLLFLPINYISLGLVTLILNSMLFYLLDRLVPSFVITSFPAALLGLLVLTTVNTVVEGWMRLEEDYSFFVRLTDRLSALTRKGDQPREGYGLVIVQIDGLSYQALRKALSQGRMPFLWELLSKQTHRLEAWFCGLPSQTSSVQAGLLYGRNEDIPGFRWFDREEQREAASSSARDMQRLEERLLGDGESLLAGGTTVNTILHGGAAKRLMTISAVLETDFKRRMQELEDFAIFSLHPYLYNRAFVLLLWDFLVDRAQTLLNRFRHRGAGRTLRFSFLRAASNAFLRECTTYFVREDLVRGVPVLYANYIGYDVVAHHAGPESWDALSVLTGIDRQIRRIARTASRSQRHYEILVFSDHGQTACVPFRRRFGETLNEFIGRILSTPVSKAPVRSAEEAYLATLLKEMEVVATGTRSPRLARRRFRLERMDSRFSPPPGQPTEAGEVHVSATGNLAHIYFTGCRERTTVEDLIQEHPGLIDALVRHPGIGLVAGLSAEGDVVVFGKGGLRRLPRGAVEGEDPFLPYGSDSREVREFERLVRFRNAGDLVIMGNLLPGAKVVSFEEQVGTHGGIGGEQTWPFLLYPSRWEKGRDPLESPAELHRFVQRAIASGRIEALPGQWDPLESTCRHASLSIL